MAATRGSRLPHRSRETSDREPRRAVALPGFALFADGTMVSVNVVNLSYDGCKIHAPASLSPGMQLTLSVLGIAGALRGAITWCQDEHAGIKFEQ